MSAEQEAAQQLSIFVENKSGELVHILKFLGENGINIRAISLADTSDFGILRILVSDPEKAAGLLKDQGFTVGRSLVVAVEVEDKPGSLAAILELLSAHAINVEYLYACARRENNQAVLIFRLDKTDDATRLLSRSGFKVIPASALQMI